MSHQPTSADPASAGLEIDDDVSIDDTQPSTPDVLIIHRASILGSTATINSSILAYRKLHGRTYANYEGTDYWGPNDERQNEQLDIAHHMMTLAFDNKLYLAPLRHPQKVLDVGTGTGIWVTDFADECPNAEVIGTDLSPIQPSWVPPNCKFEIDNCEMDWTYPDNAFDYIHIRGLVGCVQDWVKLYRECYRCLKPGGWLEQQEYALPIAANEGSLPPDSIWHTWGQVFKEAGAKIGRSFEVSDHWGKWVREAGFTGELHKNSIRLPIGGWAKDPKWKQVGLLNAASLEQGLEGFAYYLCTQALEWEEAEVAALLARVRKAIRDKSTHAYYPL
ncbi:hypothetical protein jhhlp_002932 [Lomentospora prolificans]|uniref:Methyltransferase domain-containing protein n=1 Tax=Lomentospora prolificans TaxID=41688 RepID=A0A2N3NFI9_9PEZI|nr:hypothetical protein jhhlp_002932 [Lomentospora prolificans]